MDVERVERICAEKSEAVSGRFFSCNKNKSPKREIGIAPAATLPKYLAKIRYFEIKNKKKWQKFSKAHPKDRLACNLRLHNSEL